LTAEKPDQSIRDVLFGDQDFDSWTSHKIAGEPWNSFAEAKAGLDRGDKAICVEILKRITATQGLESRHYTQAWHFLKQLGVTPPKETAKDLQGVVVEASWNGGLDIVAAYADLHARYFNFSGAAVIWERPDTTLDVAIQNLLNAAQIVVNKIGPWTDRRPAPPPQGQVRINMLTPSGLHFGQAPFQLLASDPLGGPVVAAAMKLMKELMGKTRR
jgi:hypothetical protein